MSVVPRRRCAWRSIPADQVRYEYRHSLWIKDGSKDAWPWVSGSAVIGAKEVRVSGLKNGRYRAQLLFAELEEEAQRSLDVTVQGAVIASGFSPAQQAGGTLRGAVLEVPEVVVEDGVLRVGLSAEEGETILSGIELIAVGS